VFDSAATSSCNDTNINYSRITNDENVDCIYSDCNGNCTCTNYGPFSYNSNADCAVVDCNGVCDGNSTFNACGLCADQYENLEGCDEEDIAVLEDWFGCEGSDCINVCEYPYSNVECPFYENIWSDCHISWSDGRISNIYINCLTDTIPESIGQLQSLYNLDLSNNQIRTIPESIGQLQSLYNLDLSNNQIRTIPESIDDLQLDILNLNNNIIDSIPSPVNFNAIWETNLQSNHLKSINEAICDDYNYIYLSDNKLCNKYYYDCLEFVEWGIQDQSNCCEGVSGEPNWTQCP
jgi:hypothetical protein